MARTSPLVRSAIEHISSPASRWEAARTSGSLSIGSAAPGVSIVALLAICFFSRGASSRASSGIFSEYFVQRGDGLINMRALDDERRQEAQYRIAGAVDENAPLEHLGD